MRRLPLSAFRLPPSAFRLPLLALAAACAPTPPDPARLDPVAVRYVELTLGMRHHDPDFVDAYYGPDSLKARADADTLTVAEIGAAADSLLAVLGDAVPAYADSLVAMRHRYLVGQLTAVRTRAAMLGGERLSFDDEARLLYGVTVPSFPEAHFDSLVTRLGELLPGEGDIGTRYNAFKAQVMLPAARVDTVFKVAIAACRARSNQHIALGPDERFDLEYVTGTSWNAYNWYKGGLRSLIQVNLDFPIPVDRAVDLACHEGYPGHHVYNAALEQALVRDRGWVEFSVYALFSPQSLVAEGSANFGIDMAFPGEDRTVFEREFLMPLAGIDPALAAKNAEVRVVMERLNYARNEVARRYLDGAIDSTQAIALMQRWWFQSPEAAAKTLRFIQNYRSYVINYNLGRDLVAAWVQREGGDDPARRWAAFGTLLATPPRALQ